MAVNARQLKSVFRVIMGSGRISHPDKSGITSKREIRGDKNLNGAYYNPYVALYEGIMSV